MYEMYSWVPNKRPVPPRLFFSKNVSTPSLLLGPSPSTTVVF